MHWLTACVLCATASWAHAISLGQIDAFQSGATLEWRGSVVNSVADGGPMGAGDFALQAFSGGQGITVFNEVQWNGDFTAAGVTQISMDVRNPNAFDLQLRLAISRGQRPLPHGMGPTYVTAASQTVASDGAWQLVTFNVSPVDFIPSGNNNESTPNAAAALADVFHFRVIHNPTPGVFTSTGSGSVLLDNIRALGATVANADFDEDGDVDGGDLVQWQGDFGVNGRSDADNDGDSDGADFLAWQQRLGSGLPSVAATAAVPEPAMLLLLFTVASAGFRRTAGRKRQELISE
ncbi:MAG: PEP-CTERM sorting domain-containing protein [Pirellulales bacterium]|nr:PEP-CTERM sorting domain-containing protein [Pirellulales bacterium]